MILPFRSLSLISAAAVCCSFVACEKGPERIVEQAIEKTFPADANARVSIRNVDGAVRLYGAKTTEIKVQAIKKAYGQERLDKITVDASSQGNSVVIETNYPPRPKFSWSDRSGIVDYTIVVPETCTISRLEMTNGEILIEGMRGGNVSAKLVNGRLFDHNGFGNHELFVANGGLDIVFEWWEQRKFTVDAKIVNGNVRAFIPGEASFRVVAASMTGKVASDFGDKGERPGDKMQRIDTTVGNNPQAVIELQSTAGNAAVLESNR